MPVCHAVLENDTLTLDTGRLRRTCRWNNGHLATTELRDVHKGVTLALPGDSPDVVFPGLDPAGTGEFRTRECPATPQLPAHLVAEVLTRHGALEVRRIFRLYANCPAIACDFHVRGPASALPSAPGAGADGGFRNIEDGAIAVRTQAAVCLERLALPGRHWHLEAVRFVDRSDYNNNLVATESLVPYYRERPLQGNVLIATDRLTARGVFVVKEAPCSDVQLAYPGCDYLAKIGELRAVGLGLLPADLKAGEWVRGYSVVTGLFDGSEREALIALRDYQKRRRTHQPQRDEMILMNTWGDRGQDSRVRETFALAELEAGARLGITHFQLDDGWQSGQSSNSATQGGSLNRIWNNPRYWTPHPARFPGGLKPVVDRGRALGLEVCLWFNPSADDSYAHWGDDAEALIRLHREYGIRTFKIDGVEIPDKRAEINLRAMLDTVMAALGGEAVFNLDVTAGRRYGFHYFTEYGNLFVENRYTDWGNYYPHWALRNLWQLSRHVPAESLQVEFLNRWRNAAKYPDDDPLAPQKVPFDYCFAIAMMAQPLAWFEGTGLPEEAFAIAPLLQLYRQHREALHAGTILPIGEEPSGCGWTGLQSLAADGIAGYLLVFREWNQRGDARLQTWLPPDAPVVLESLWGQASVIGSRTDDEGRLRVALPHPFTFGWFRYRLG